MSDETLSAEPGELETPAIVQPEPTNLQTELETPAIGEGGEPEPAEDEDDLDFGFKKYRVPKSLKENVEKLQATFTQKTQATAAERQALDDERARLTEQAKASEEEMGLRVQARHIESQIEAYNQKPATWWQELKDTDPQLWNEHRWNYQALEKAQSEAQKKISDADAKRTHETQTATSKRIEQAESYAASKGWKPEKLEQVVQFAIERGAGEHKMDKQAVGQMLQSNMSPLMLDFLDLARLGSEVLKKQASPNASPTIAPLEVVGAKRNPAARIDLNDPNLPMEDYARIRREQRKANERR